MKIACLAIGLGLSLVLASACGGSDTSTVSSAPADAGRPLENTGQSCAGPSDCYAGVEAGSVKGEVQCLDRVTGGYCTHLCATDADCCAVPGECTSGFKQVCSPFESTGKMMCFLSCEKEDLKPAPDGGVLDDSAYCTTYASSAFSCRSSGGGNKNRKVCVP